MNTNEGELAAFIAYAIAFKIPFLALIDTYDTLESGAKNFMIVSLALHELGYRPVGVRLDSGDLSFLSKEVRKIYIMIGEKYNIDYFKELKIVASNDINEKVLLSLKEQGNEIDTFGVGTHLVTCQK